MASLIPEYRMEQRSLAIPSFTLYPDGEERSTIRRHLSECFFGITPMGLVCTAACWLWDSGPARCPAASLVRMYSSMI